MELRAFLLQKLLGALSSSFSRPILADRGQSSCFASRMWLSHKISKVSEKQQLSLQLQQKHFTHSIPLSFQGRPLKPDFLHKASCPNFLLFSPQHSPIQNFLETNAAIKYFKCTVLEILSVTLSLRTPVSYQITKCVLWILQKFRLFKLYCNRQKKLPVAPRQTICVQKNLIIFSSDHLDIAFHFV